MKLFTLSVFEISHFGDDESGYFNAHTVTV